MSSDVKKIKSSEIICICSRKYSDKKTITVTDDATTKDKRKAISLGVRFFTQQI